MSVLPPAFAELEPFADWALQGEGARYDKRLASSIEELQLFYDAAFPFLDAAREHLEQVPYTEDMGDEDKHLTWLLCALCTVSFPVEVWRQPRVPDSGPSAINAVVEPPI